MMTIESRAEAERSLRKGGMCSTQDTAHMRSRHDHRVLDENASLRLTIEVPVARPIATTHLAANTANANGE